MEEFTAIQRDQLHRIALFTLGLAIGSVVVLLFCIVGQVRTPAKAMPPADDSALLELQREHSRLMAADAELAQLRDDVRTALAQDEQTKAALDAVNDQLETARRIADARVASTAQIVGAACRARLLNVDAQVRLLPPSVPLSVVVKLLEAATGAN